MSKRFSVTEKWQDEWFSSLKPLEKLVFLFIVDNCDNAGFFEVNKRLNSFLIGLTETEYLTALKGLEKGFVWSTCGRKIFVVKFLFHQKNLPLNYENNAHKQILNLIEMNKKCFEYDFEKLGANEGLNSPIGNGTGKGIGKEEEHLQKIFEKMRTKLDRKKFSDNLLQDEAKSLFEKYGYRDKIDNLVGAWVSNLTPDIEKKKMVL